MILAHVTKQPFPLFDPLWIVTGLLGLDANAEWLFERYEFDWRSLATQS